jgi:hypothetical protein
MAHLSVSVLAAALALGAYANAQEPGAMPTLAWACPLSWLRTATHGHATRLFAANRANAANFRELPVQPHRAKLQHPERGGRMEAPETRETSGRARPTRLRQPGRPKPS